MNIEMFVKIIYFLIGALPIIYYLFTAVKDKPKSSKKYVQPLLYSVCLIIVLAYFYDSFFN
jgi:hypothetical protein